MKVFPTTTRVLDMVPDDPGTSWLYRCHVNEHIDNGMEVLFLRSHLQIVLALLAKSQTLIDNNNSTG
ncbi:MAG TPA: multicopper oxidase domain-containing protein [Nitrososphaera sp.]|nr:multicopper oxidase domain-containing protein [Nitrososphaera sp.]